MGAKNSRQPATDGARQPDNPATQDFQRKSAVNVVPRLNVSQLSQELEEDTDEGSQSFIMEGQSQEWTDEDPTQELTSQRHTPTKVTAEDSSGHTPRPPEGLQQEWSDDASCKDTTVQRIETIEDKSSGHTPRPTCRSIVEGSSGHTPRPQGGLQQEWSDDASLTVRAEQGIERIEDESSGHTPRPQGGLQQEWSDDASLKVRAEQGIERIEDKSSGHTPRPQGGLQQEWSDDASLTVRAEQGIERIEDKSSGHTPRSDGVQQNQGLSDDEYRADDEWPSEGDIELNEGHSPDSPARMGFDEVDLWMGPRHEGLDEDVVGSLEMLDQLDVLESFHRISVEGGGWEGSPRSRRSTEGGSKTDQHSTQQRGRPPAISVDGALLHDTVRKLPLLRSPDKAPGSATQARTLAAQGLMDGRQSGRRDCRGSAGGHGSPTTQSRWSYHPGMHRLAADSVYEHCFRRFHLLDEGCIKQEAELQAIVLYLVYSLRVQVPVPVMEDLILEQARDMTERSCT